MKIFFSQQGSSELCICRCGSQINSLLTGLVRSPLNNSDWSDDLLWLAQWWGQHLAEFIFSLLKLNIKKETETPTTYQHKHQGNLVVNDKTFFGLDNNETNIANVCVC